MAERPVAQLEVGDPLGAEHDVVRAEQGQAEGVGERRGRARRDHRAEAGGARGQAEIADFAVGAEHDLVARLAVGEADALDAAEQDDAGDGRERAEIVEPPLDPGPVVIIGRGQRPGAEPAGAEAVGGDGVDAAGPGVEAVDEEARGADALEAVGVEQRLDRRVDRRRAAPAAPRFSVSTMRLSMSIR